MNADMGGGGSVGRFSAGCWRQGRSRRVAAAVGPAAATGLGATAVQQLQQQQQGAQQVVTVYDLSDEVVDYEQVGSSGGVVRCACCCVPRMVVGVSAGCAPKPIMQSRLEGYAGFNLTILSYAMGTPQSRRRGRGRSCC